jgi:hypothetical protein
MPTKKKIQIRQPPVKNKNVTNKANLEKKVLINIIKKKPRKITIVKVVKSTKPKYTPARKIPVRKIPVRKIPLVIPKARYNNKRTVNNILYIIKKRGKRGCSGCGKKIS